MRIFFFNRNIHFKKKYNNIIRMMSSILDINKTSNINNKNDLRYFI